MAHQRITRAVKTLRAHWATALRHVPFSLFVLICVTGMGWITAQMIQVTT